MGTCPEKVKGFLNKVKKTVGLVKKPAITNVPKVSVILRLTVRFTPHFAQFSKRASFIIPTPLLYNVSDKT